MVGTDFPTTSELLDALEAAWRTRASGNNVPVATAEALRHAMAATALTPAEFAATFSVSQRTVEEWLSGHAPSPRWACAGAHLLALLPPSARRKVLGRPDPTPAARQSRPHPFSRIEEL